MDVDGDIVFRKGRTKATLLQLSIDLNGRQCRLSGFLPLLCLIDTRIITGQDRVDAEKSQGCWGKVEDNDVSA